MDGGTATDFEGLRHWRHGTEIPFRQLFLHSWQPGIARDCSYSNVDIDVYQVHGVEKIYVEQKPGNLRGCFLRGSIPATEDRNTNIPDTVQKSELIHSIFRQDQDFVLLQPGR